MARVVHFEIHADDPERAAKFYQAAFGWSVSKWDGPMDYWLVTTGEEDQPGINGAIMKRQCPAGGEGFSAFVCTLDVESYDDTAAKVEAAGGGVTSPKQAVPGVGWHGYFSDTEGNTFGAMQPDENAK